MDGNDTFVDGSGINIFEGGTGNDTYITQLTTDSVVEQTGGGNDSVQTLLASFTLPANVENLTSPVVRQLTPLPTRAVTMCSIIALAVMASIQSRTSTLITPMQPNMMKSTCKAGGLNFGAVAVTTVSGGIVVGIPGGDAIFLKAVTASSLEVGDFFF